MRRHFAALVAASAFVLTGCYHAVVDTGRAPSAEPQIVKPWASSFIYGLVPPPVTETAQRCKGGLAKVETQHSFLNGLVAGVTFGLYTPITITVTCASATAALPGAKTLDVGSGDAPDAARAFQQAIELSDRTDAAVYLKY